MYNQWADQAYEFLKDYIGYNAEFKTEDLRAASELIIPEPSSKRAWGGVIRKAVKAGLIERIGFSYNSSSNAAPFWKVINYQHE